MGKRKPQWKAETAGASQASDDPTDSNQTVLTSADIAARKQAAKESKANSEAEAPQAVTPQSKALTKKLAQIEARKRKASERDSVIASLAANQLSDSHLKLLGSSGALGQSKNKRQRLQRALHAKREGAALDGLEPLEIERTVPIDVDDYEEEPQRPAAVAAKEQPTSSRAGRGSGMSKAALPAPPASSTHASVAKVPELAADDLDDLGDEEDDAYWAARATGFGLALQGLPSAAPTAAVRSKPRLPQLSTREELVPPPAVECPPVLADPPRPPLPSSSTSASAAAAEPAAAAAPARAATSTMAATEPVASAAAQRLLCEQRRTLGAVRNAIRNAGARSYRKHDHWAWYAFPTTKAGDADPHATALADAADARAVLGVGAVRAAWASVLELLSAALLAQQSRAVLPAIDHGRVDYFLREWAKTSGTFFEAAAEHAGFAAAVRWRLHRRSLTATYSH